MLLAGLGPNGVAGIVLDDEVQCPVEPNVNNGSVETGGAVAWQCFLFFMVLALLIFLWRTFRMAKDALDSFEHLYTQHAILDSAHNQLQNRYEELKKQHEEQRELVNILKRCLNEPEGNQEMLSDQFQGLHYGVIMLGGYCNNSELTPQQRQHMYNVERANLVAARTMGANRFMATVLQQKRGSAVGGDDTDPATMEDDEGGESEQPRASDLPVAEVEGGQLGTLTQVHDTLRGQFNAFLAREMWADAELVQQLIMVLPELLNGAQPLQRGPRIQLFQRLGDRMEIIADRQRQHGKVLVANRFQGYADQLRNLVFVD